MHYIYKSKIFRKPALLRIGDVVEVINNTGHPTLGQSPILHLRGDVSRIYDETCNEHGRQFISVSAPGYFTEFVCHIEQIKLIKRRPPIGGTMSQLRRYLYEGETNNLPITVGTVPGDPSIYLKGSSVFAIIERESIKLKPSIFNDLLIQFAKDYNLKVIELEDITINPILTKSKPFWKTTNPINNHNNKIMDKYTVSNYRQQVTVSTIEFYDLGTTLYGMSDE